MWPQQGFTLLEMAVVLMIVGLLLGGMLVPLSAQMEQRNNSDTQKDLAEIKEALIGFALANGRLPCPAEPGIATGVLNAGLERARPCDGIVNSTGVLPWATLGVRETDGWGNRYTYRVTDYFADDLATTTYGCVPVPANPVQASFALCSPGTLTVWSAPAAILADLVPAVIISHGKNGAGAYTPQGIPIPEIAANSDERENSESPANSDYMSHPPTPTFDDLVAWISPNILRNRMVTAGRLP